MTEEEYKAIRLAAVRGIVGVGGDQGTCALVLEPLDRIRAAEDSMRAEVELEKQRRQAAEDAQKGLFFQSWEFMEERDTARTELAQTKEKLAALMETHREALINLRGYASAMRDHKVVEHVNGQLAELAAAPPEPGKEGG